MKAGILTFHKANNYGAVLQAYALSQQLQKLGVDNDFIKISGYDVDANKHIPQNESHNPLIRKIKAEKLKRASLFEEFRQKHMANSFECSIYDSDKLNDEYDFFLVGSDQVWNFSIPDTNLSFFLPFATPKKRFSYAASFGNQDIPQQYYDICKKLLSEFTFVSVREKEGAQQLFDLTGRDAIISPDPTLLLDRNDWSKLTHDICGERYVLLFLLTYDEGAVAIAKQIAEEKHITIKTISAGFMPQFGFHSWSGYGVEDWLSLINNSEFVVTNSFHGIVFSLIFQKCFCAMPLIGDLAKRNGRITELLQKVSLANCYARITCEIDYGRVTTLMADFRQRGLNYLSSIIKVGASQ